MQVKKRWDGKTIVDLFADEFRQRPHEYYVQAVECGRIRVDGKIVSPSYVVHDSQKLSHFVHRHEPPVMAESVTILEEGVDVITVCKPPSVPVHACGQYRKNTVVGILQAEHNNIGPLFRIL
jgi:tRNA pseudouridine synthase 9